MANYISNLCILSYNVDFYNNLVCQFHPEMYYLILHYTQYINQYEDYYKYNYIYATL